MCRQSNQQTGGKTNQTRLLPAHLVLEPRGRRLVFSPLLRRCDVAQPQRHDVTGSEAQTREQQQDGVIAQARLRLQVAAPQQTLDVSRIQSRLLRERLLQV